MVGVSACAEKRNADDRRSELPLTEFMGHVLQHNAERLWAWTALESDRNGQHSGQPRSAAEWEQAESDALTLQQLTYTLERSNQRIDDPRWNDLVQQLRAATTASAEAAERRNFAALTKAGDDINARCVACHRALAPQLEVTPPPVPLR